MENSNQAKRKKVRLYTERAHL